MPEQFFLLHMKIIEPGAAEDFEKYYRLRWEVLRKPWHEPRGTEKADDDATSIHALLVNEAGGAIGVCRLHLTSPAEGQIRFMAIAPTYQGQGLGHLLLAYLEDKARQLGVSNMMLQAREKAVRFYERAGYRVVEKSYVLFGEIQHYRMEKELFNPMNESMDE
jgi:N-acetylglutamate synthase-like GNAT family acetyltransferase